MNDQKNHNDVEEWGWVGPCGRHARDGIGLCVALVVAMPEEPRMMVQFPCLTLQAPLYVSRWLPDEGQLQEQSLCFHLYWQYTGCP